jgi:diguanylate cyclase (GGDEF)-like protein/PAS domain S-box-containing protein
MSAFPAPQGSSFLRELLESLPGIVYALDADFKYVFWNRNLELLTGRSAADLMHLTPLDIVPPEERERVRERIASDFKDGVGGTETYLTARDGTRIPYSFSARRVTIDGADYLVGLGIDVSNVRAIEEGLRHERLMFRAITESTRDMTTIVSREAIITYESPAVERILGYRPEELVGKHVAEYLHPDDLESAMLILTTAIADEVPRDDPYDVRFRHKNGEYRLLAVTGGMLGEMGLVVSSRDITEQRAAEREVVRLASYDELTRLPNRNLSLRSLEDCIASARSTGSVGYLLYLDIDRFKSVNDSLGHHCGDRLLQQASDRLRAIVPPGATLARHGGDEFIVALPSDATDANHDAEILAQRILAAFRAPFAIDVHELHVTCSIGFCRYPDDGADVETLLRHADTAMYEAKAAGRNTYRRFVPEMNARVHATLTLANDLHRGLASGEFDTAYQPVIDVATETIVGYEALIRWHRSDGVAVGPADFIPVAEDIGLIEELGLLVFERACRRLRAWSRAGRTGIVMSVNVSVRQLLDRDFVRAIGACAQLYDVKPQSIDLEITENIFANEDPAIGKSVDELRALGFGIVIDDFGVGYSSLGYLRRLAPTKVKVDRAFVSRMLVEPGAAAIVKAVVGLGRAFGFSVVAEGVETRAEFDAIRAAGCDLAQGYLFGRPQAIVNVAATEGQMAARLK